MSPLSHLLLLPSALAATPVVLPTEEAEEDWVEPLELAGLEPGPGGAGARVIVEERGVEWIVVAIHGDRVRTTRVRAPNTPVEREELAHLAASMVAALTRSEGPSLPPPPAPPTEPEPRPVLRVEPEPSPPEPVPVAPPPEPVIVLSEAPAVELPGEPPSLDRPEVASPVRRGPPLATRLGLDLSLGGGAAPRGGVRVLTGPRLGRVDLLLGAATSAQADMDWLGAGRSVQSWRGMGGLWWHPSPLVVGAQVGVDLRYFPAATEGALAWVPFAGLEAGVGVELAESLSVVPHLRLRRDLGALPLEVGPNEAVEQPLWWGSLAVELRVRTGQP